MYILHRQLNGKFLPLADFGINLEKAEEFNGQFTDVFNKNEHT